MTGVQTCALPIFFYRQGLLLFLILATIFSFYIILGKASRPVLSGRHKLMTTEGIPMILMAVIAILSEFLMNQLGWFQPVYIITIGSYSASLVAFLVLVFLYVKILIFTISFVRENLLKQRRLLYSKNIPLLLFTLIGWGTIRIIMAASETFDLEFSSQLYLNLTCRHIVLFIIMGTMASMLVFFFDKCNISIILSSYLGNRQLVLCGVIITLSISYYFFSKPIFLALLLLCTLSLIQFIGKESIGRNWLLKNSLLLLITAAIMGGILFQAQQTRNEAKKKLYLHTVDIKESGDPITMSLFRDIVNQIHRDSIISQNYLANGKIEEAQTYIQERYFSGYWNQFMISTTLCYSGDSLQTDLNSRKICCMDYFRVLAEKSPNQFFDSPELKLVEYGQNLSGYIGIIPLGPTGPFAFIEMVPGNIIRTVGFSDVFRDQEIRNRIELGSYSFARYSKHHLVSHTGIITFPYHIPEFLKSEKKYFSIHHQGVHYNGLLSSGGSLYIIACENNYFTNYIALFSVIFIFSAISYLIIVFAIAHEQQSLLSLKLLAARFQITLVSIIVVSMILTGFYFLRAYGKFQQSRLESRVSEKTHSINLEFQHKVENFGPQWIINTQTTRAFAQKLGNIFFADIHLFNASGELISSTSPVLYEKGLSSGFIHPLAYQRILIERAPIFIQDRKSVV